ncbi:MAG: hypothetical protein CMP84_05465, partial [Gammaproteobacteria bacterium]|nr:hypothetical protein [Gammaproteobacteria bacterium]
MTKPSHAKLLPLPTITALLLACGEQSATIDSDTSPSGSPDSALTRVNATEQTAPGSFASAGNGAQNGEWQAYGGDIGSTKYTSLDSINLDNVGDLELAWRRPALDQYYFDINPNQRYTNSWNAAPVIVDGIAYITNGVGLVEAFNPGTGETLWTQEPPGGADGLPGAPTRGVAFWQESDEARVFVQRGTF